MNVLLVEDDPGIGRFVTRGLAAHGYRVAWERDGARVLDLLAADGFAAALIDLGLPDGDGLQLCRALRAGGRQIPVLMLTARGTLQDRLDGFAAGADDYLPKPFAFDELVARLAAITRRGTPVPPPSARFGSLTLDPARQGAAVGDALIPLSRREFALLRALVDRAGAVATRDVLAQAVWGSDAVTDNALDVYVSYVRRRLADHAAAPVLETVRGVGFRLVEPVPKPASSQGTTGS